MKRIALILAAAMLLSVGLWSCEKGNDNNNSASGGGDNGGGGNGGGEPYAEWVDLGLPSGLQWFSCNVGATRPEEYGNYYAWGETETKSIYKWDNYRYSTYDAVRSLVVPTKYNNDSELGTVDDLTVLQPGDDAATANMGNGARTPTREEWEELLDHTSNTWTSMNGVYGWKFTASNNASLFLPAAGYRLNGELSLVGEYGYYWSSSLYTDNPVDPLVAWNFGFFSEWSDIYRNDRCRGFPVRAVRSSQKCQ